MNEIKLIIFDLDGTLYNLDDVVSMNYEMQLNFYSSHTGQSKEQTIKIFEENNIYPVMTEKSKSATEFFVRSGILAKEWNDYREENFDVSVIDKHTVADGITIDGFSEIAPLVLLSSNSLSNIEKILDWIGIASSKFTDIICSDHKYSEGAFSKIEEMKLLSERFDVDPCHMFSIGDRYRTDIEPLVKLGGMGQTVKGPQDLHSVLESLKMSNLHTI